jgi:aminopeptidase N
MTKEIEKQEKNLKNLEYNLKRSMEDDQSDFAQEIQSLQIEVLKLKELSHAEHAAANAELVRKLNASISHASERARIYNTREALFNSQMTEYSELNELTKTFEVGFIPFHILSIEAYYIGKLFISRTLTYGTLLTSGLRPKRIGPIAVSLN